MTRNDKAAPHPGAGRSSRFRRGARLVLLPALLLVGALSWYAWDYYSGRESTDDAQIDGDIMPIAPRVGGTVLAVHIEDNQFVKAGIVMVEIDPADFKVVLEREEANLADAKAALLAARSGVPITSTTTASQVTSAQANLERAEAGRTAAAMEVDLARARLASAGARLRENKAEQVRAARDLERLKQLVEKDEVSRQQYDAAVADEEASRARVDAAQATVSEAERSVAVAESRQVQAARMVEEAQAALRSARTAPEQVAVTRARVAAAEAKVKLAEAAIAQATLNLRYTTIECPLDGIVSKKSVLPGQVVQAGQPLLAIVPLDDIWVTANFKETQLREMRPGQPCIISVDAYGKKFRGRVESIAAATGARFSLLPPENATGNYVKVVQRIPVKIVFEKGQDPEMLLRPGMSVVPTVLTR